MNKPVETPSSSSKERAVDQLQTRLAAIEKRYRTQFTSLDSLLARMSGQSSSLASQLSALQSSG